MLRSAGGVPLFFGFFLGCQVNLAEVGKPEGAGIRTVEATAPPAPNVGGDRLYHSLYAGEVGENAPGQRLRILAWLQYVAFDRAQLQNLLGLTKQIRNMQAQSERDLQGLRDSEAQNLSPLYQELVARYAKDPPPTEKELEEYGRRLEQARQQSYGGTDPKGAHFQQVKKALTRVQGWVEKLPEDQKNRISACRFFLQRKLGPFTNPGDYGLWLGTAWSGANFASLKTEMRPVDEGQMDIGGLFSSEDAEKGRDGAALQGLRVAVLLLFAIETDGFLEAVEVRMGERDPGSY